MRKATRDAVFIYNEGRSALTGEPLGVDWEVDHRRPRAHDGTDDIQNLQALTKRENRMKGSAYPPELRDWQQQFVGAWRRSTEKSFLLVALPGAGKTIAALTIASKWISEQPMRRRIIIVVPTDALRTQWQREAAHHFGLQFQTKEFTRFKSGMVGGIYTYQLLCTQSPELYKLICAEHEVLVIADEIHHTSQSNDWGVKFREALYGAQKLLLTSGTPFRGDSKTIPFVNYDGEGRCVTDAPYGFKYDYPQAIRDQVIRVVCFEHHKGIVRCAGVNGLQSYEVSTDASKTEADDGLSRILEAGEYTERLLLLANDRLTRLRQVIPDAAALVLCKDQRHAQDIAAQLQRLTGRAPALVVSDDERATSTVDQFRASSDPWVVAVRQISEGVDISRLMVLVYLTNARTSLFFRQAVGRIVRYMNGEDLEAYCVMPDHRELVQHALDIVRAQVQAIEEDNENETDARDPLGPRNAAPEIVLDSAHLGSAGIILEGESLDAAVAAAVERLAQELELSQKAAWRVYKKYETHSTEARASAPPPPVLEKELERRRQVFNRIVRQAAFRRFGRDDPEGFQKVYVLAHQHFGKRSIADYSLDELDAAIVYVRELA